MKDQIAELRAQVRQYKGFGKFEHETVLAPALYELSMSGCDEEAGGCSEGHRWHGLLNGPFRSFGAFADIPPNVDLTEAERAYLALAAGAIVNEDDNGFVHVQVYESASEMAQAWNDIVRDAGGIEDSDACNFDD